MSSAVKWLLESNVFDHYADEMVAAARALDIEIKLTPEVGYGYSWDDSRAAMNRLYPAGSDVIFHGSIGMATDLASHSIWRNTTFCSWENLECATYYCHFGPFLINNDYAMLPFGELTRRRRWLFDTFGDSGSIFVRPNSCGKSFTGQLVSDDTFDQDLEVVGFYDLPANAVVVATTPKQIDCEWRLVIVNKQIVASCQYKEFGRLKSRPDCPASVLDWFRRTVLTVDWEPDDAWTADVCLQVDGTYRLLEIGSVTCSDLYACDKLAFIQAMTNLVVARSQTSLPIDNPF